MSWVGDGRRVYRWVIEWVDQSLPLWKGRVIAFASHHRHGADLGGPALLVWEGGSSRSLFGAGETSGRPLLGS